MDDHCKDRTDVQRQDNTMKNEGLQLDLSTTITSTRNAHYSSNQHQRQMKRIQNSTQELMHPGLGVHVHKNGQLKENELTGFRTLNCSVQVKAQDAGNTSTVPEW
ncbi:hypothetical protein LR48_Vigan86s000800 [Vigna angularis]|uniref:Uncharacterized protein n=1 Tax=Phaseolus angularis TaxID=3914 RepID=A0A0L9T5A7_PHAAN|nr:hypothetical protein LR48_Vigan86s000800 [Vigna angularis]